MQKAVVSMPGGCPIGLRPIDLHLKALRELGVDIQEEHGYIKCSTDKIVGGNIHLDFQASEQPKMLCLPQFVRRVLQLLQMRRVNRRLLIWVTS